MAGASGVTEAVGDWTAIAIKPTRNDGERQARSRTPKTFHRSTVPPHPAYLATLMGTSIRELEDTYFRWLTRTDEQLLAVFDAYDAAPLAATPAT